MRIYIASKISNRPAAVMLAYKLTKMGHHITSRWLECEDEVFQDKRSGKIWEEHAREWGFKDMVDLEDADAAVFLSVPEGMRGTWVEYGMALIYDKDIHWVGSKDQTVFTHLDTTRKGKIIKYHRDAEELLQAMTAAKVAELAHSKAAPRRSKEE